jgi:predicted MFS family arabinose efflux permease
MHMPHDTSGRDTYLIGRGEAWFAFAMTIALMVFDYVDRQVIVSLFPHMKADWGLSDKQLGALVSVVSITVALGALPVALVADRYSRVKSIVVMAAVWSLASISCMFTRGYGQLVVARSLVGLGEAGYGAVGSALIASHFPRRLRGALMAAFFAAASVGSVLGVVLGGVIAAHWGWKAAFGVVGIPGLVLALLYLRVRDYPHRRADAAAGPRREHLGRRAAPRPARADAVAHAAVGVHRRRRAARRGVGAVVVAAELPQPGARGGAGARRHAGRAGGAGRRAGQRGVGRAGRPPRPRATAAQAAAAGAAVPRVDGRAGGRLRRPGLGLALGTWEQLALIAAGGFLATCTVGPVTAIVIDVVHPGVRSTGASVLSLFQNLFGLAAGPFIAGALSDAWGLSTTLVAMPSFAIIAAFAFRRAARSYVADMERASAPTVAPEVPPADGTPALT